MGVTWYGDEFLEKIKERLQEGLDAAAEYTTGEAKFRCPVDTGVLRNSITWGELENGDRIVGTPVEYGLYQEVGFLAGGQTFVQNPYLLPALLDNQEQIANIVLKRFG